ncbi:hypothetical protein EVAR_7417_1 [Eumeta japonica]|uniref:Uncharacterized protein n=1 Tax=Eumeta variegata TaxID=151549 RepID=A0A4C1V9H4_EUMVA|nr:hypothetical protein EVAR_7417_1 [Eumeta japonica]
MVQSDSSKKLIYRLARERGRTRLVTVRRRCFHRRATAAPARGVKFSKGLRSGSLRAAPVRGRRGSRARSNSRDRP